MASEKINAIVDAVSELSVLELAELVSAVEEKFGVSAAAAVMTAGPAAAAAGPVEDEKTEFDVVLTEVGASKMNVIKAVRELTGLGLKEAKEKADNVPSVIKEAVAKDVADEAKEKLEAAGAKVELK